MATGVIGAKIVLEGEAQYRKALRDIKNEQAELRSEMKLCNAEYKDAENSTDALRKKYEILAKQADQSAKKIDVYSKAIETSTQKEKLAKDQIDKLSAELETAEGKYKEMAESSETTAEALKEQEEAINKLKTDLKNANSDYDKAVEATTKYKTALNLANVEMNELQSEIQQTSRYLDEAEKSSDGVAHSMDEYSDNVDKASKGTSTFGDVLKANLASQVIIDGIKKLAKAVKDVAEACIETGMAFESSMSNVQALSGATAEEMEKLANSAKDLGESTIFSASQVADAFGYMALAGWDTENMLEGINGVLNLAAAASMDLAEASDIVTDYLTAFGLEAKDSSKFVDQMAFAMANSNTNVTQLGEAYKNCAATAGSMGFEVSEVTAALATMANAGIKGGEAGTALNAVMTRLATDTKECATTLASYGVEVYDSEENLNSLSSILEGIADVFSELTDQEQANLSKMIAGQHQYSAFQTIMNGVNASVEEGTMGFADYKKALDKCDGSADQMAKTMQNNLKGKLTELSSAFEAVRISAYELFDEELKNGVEGATGALRRLNTSLKSGGLNTSLETLSKEVGSLIDKAVDWTERNLPKIIDGVTALIRHGDNITSALKGAAAAFLTFKTATTAVTVVTTAMQAFASVTGKAETAQKALNIAANANPYIVLAAALTGVAIAAASLIKNYSGLTIEQEAFVNSADRLKSSTDALIDSSSKREEQNKKSVEAISIQSEKAKDLVEDLFKLNSAYSENNDTMAEQKAKVAELNSLYPEMSLSVNENTNSISASKDAILDYIEAASGIAKVEAYQSAMSDTMKSIVELEAQKLELQPKLAEAQEQLNAATEKYNKEMDKAADAGSLVMVSWAEKDYQKVVDAYNEIEQSIADNDAAIDNLNERYGYYAEQLVTAEATTKDMDAALEGLNSTAEKTESTICSLSENVSKDIVEMHDKVEGSIQGQINLLSEWQEAQKISYKDLTKNLDDQTKALEDWVTNLNRLAESGIDAGLYKTLAEMGPEGAGYVQAFVDMSTKDNKAWEEYQENFAKATKLRDDVVDGIVEDYSELAGYIMEGMSIGILDDETVLASIGTLSQDMYDEFKRLNGINSPSTVYEDLALFIGDGIAAGIEGSVSTVSGEMEDLSSNLLSTAKQKMINGGDYISIGEQIAAGIAQGIGNGSSGVLGAMQSLCSETIKKAKKELEINSPSKKFEYLGEMTGEGYMLGLEESMRDVNSMISSAMEGNATSAAAARGNGGVITQIAELLGRYLPDIAENETPVILTGDANKMFNIMRRENAKFTKQTGQSAFA